jgi:hypothetical protein
MASSSQDISGKGRKRKSMAAEPGGSGVEVVLGESSTTVGPVFGESSSQQRLVREQRFRMVLLPFVWGVVCLKLITSK